MTTTGIDSAVTDGTNNEAAAATPVVGVTTDSATPTDPVTAKLQELGVPTDVIGKIKTDLGAETVEDLVGLKEEDLTGIGMKPLPARKLLKVLVPAVTQTTATILGQRVATASTVRLQEPPTAASWLSSLSAIRPQIIQPATVMTGLKAAMADTYGYFQLPRKMMNMLREAADKIGEGVPDLYFDLQNLTNARRYGALVAWMNGKGSACTVTERNRFLGKMNDRFWDSIEMFYAELDAWRKGRRESVDAGESLAAALSGEVQIYDATQVRAAALALGDSINRVFSGTGVYAATALALDNEKLQEVLSNLDFRQFGVQSREQLLAELGCAVPAEMVSAESTIGKFVWNAMALKDMAAGGNDEQKFLIELASIGAGRQWNVVKSLASKKPGGPIQEDDDFFNEEDSSTKRLTGVGGRRNQ